MRIAVAVVLVGLTLLPGVARAQNTKSGKGPMKDPASKANASVGGPATWNGKTLAQWRLELNHEDASKRTAALMALLQFGKAAAKTVRDVINRLHDPDVSPRAKACLVLRYMEMEGEDVSRVVKALSLRLYPPGTNNEGTESQAIIRYEAALTLERFVYNSEAILPALIQGTKDRSSWEIRRLCLSLLWRAAMNERSGPDDRAVAAMLDALRGGSRVTYQEKLEIMQGLAMMGQTANKNVLAREINDLHSIAGGLNTPPALAIWAYAGLAAVGDARTANRAMSRISSQLEHKTLEIRAQAAQALGTLGEKAKGKVPALLKVVKNDSEGQAVYGACLALIRIKDVSPPVVNALVDLLDHKDPRHAMAGVKALVDLKCNDARVMGAMDKMLEKKDLDINLRAYIDAGLKELKKPAKK